MQIKTETPPEYSNFPEHQDAKLLKKEERIINNALIILETRLRTYGIGFTRPETSKHYFVMKLRDLEAEEFHVVFLNSQHQLIEHKVMFYGTIDGASIYPREVAKLALKLNSSAVIFAHNHPSGSCDPSEADKRITAKLKSALELFDIRVLDHIIVGGVSTYAFSENGLI